MHREKLDTLAGLPLLIFQRLPYKGGKIMLERKAVYYGQVELIPGIICDRYVLDDNSAVMSERGTADLLGMHHKSLQSMAVNWPQKVLKPFVDNGLSMATNLVEVVAKNNFYQGRKIVVYSSQIIENLIRPKTSE